MEWQPVFRNAPPELGYRNLNVFLETGSSPGAKQKDIEYN